MDKLLHSDKETHSQKELADLSSKLKKDIKNIFQKIIDYFNEHYTVEIARSSYHTTWFDGNIIKINNISMTIKKFAREISFNTDFFLSIEDLVEMLKLVNNCSKELFEYLLEFGFSEKQVLYNSRNFLQSKLN